MKKENNVEANVIIHEKAYSKKMRFKLMKRQTKNGISPWQKTENKKNGVHILQERNESTPTLIHTATSKPLPLSAEDGTEDFNIELTNFNDLMVRCNSITCSEYMPYYRTDTILVENFPCINSEANQKSPEGENRVQSNCCVFKLKHKEESSNERELDTEYFPYYRTYEEYLSSSNPSVEIKSREKNEEADTNNDEKIRSEAVSNAETEYANTDFQENSITNEDTGQCLENFDFTETLLSTNSTIDYGDSENFLLEEILIRNQLPSSSNGYFPYYRTYGKLIVTPEDSINFSHSDNILG
ncbi:hypothetical protein NXF25_005318 [Crotalus adamanteus]|uniref:Uncharacterized protein n=1 Tax=Crotalus adamanteus TaxID=8729 RepID=A0AAW1BWL1_CROAD